MEGSTYSATPEESVFSLMVLDRVVLSYAHIKCVESSQAEWPLWRSCLRDKSVHHWDRIDMFASLACL